MTTKHDHDQLYIVFGTTLGMLVGKKLKAISPLSDGRVFPLFYRRFEVAVFPCFRQLAVAFSLAVESLRLITYSCHQLLVTLSFVVIG